MSLLIHAARFVRSRIVRHSGTVGNETSQDLYARIWTDAACTLGATAVRLSDGFVEVRLGNRHTRMRENHLMIDHPATVALTRSKGLVTDLLRAEGLPVPDGVNFDAYHLKSPREFLDRTGGPCVVKPATGFSGGAGVTPNVTSPRTLRRAALYGSVFTRDLRIEKQIPGDCYRLLYLDGELLDAVLRHPPSVVGDGRSTVRALIAAENTRRAERRGAAAKLRITLTPDCRRTLALDGLTLRSVPERGRRVRVKTATNESSAGDCESVLARIGPALAEEGRRAARATGVRLAGLDVITRDPARSLKESAGAVLEVNAIPGLHYHYQTRNPEDAVPVANLVLRTLLRVPERATATRPVAPAPEAASGLPA